jgi:hypothetical protein
MKVPSGHLAALAEGRTIDSDDYVLMLTCQKCSGTAAWIEWIEFNSPVLIAVTTAQPSPYRNTMRTPCPSGLSELWCHFPLGGLAQPGRIRMLPHVRQP